MQLKTMGLILLAAVPLRAASAAEAPPAAKADHKMDSTEIVDRANKALRGDSNHAQLTMTVVTPAWTRELKIESWNRGRQMAYIVIHSPPKEEGTTTLRRGGKMWMWMPRVERMMKVPPTMMHSSWQGSDFTYEDIVKADSIVKDYDHKLLSTKMDKDYEIHVFEALPKPDAPVVWGRIVFTVGIYPDGWVIPLEEEDYSERGEKVRTITLSEIKVLGGRRVPTRLVCVPHRKEGRKTMIEYHDLDFEVKLKDSFFSLNRLQK